MAVKRISILLLAAVLVMAGGAVRLDLPRSAPDW